MRREEIWEKTSQELFELEEKTKRKIPFEFHLYLYKAIYPEWQQLPCPAWFPNPDVVSTTNLAKLMALRKCTTYLELHRWSIQHRSEFWRVMVEILNIRFDVPYKEVLDLSLGVENPIWFQGAKLNIVSSCFAVENPETKIAIIQESERGWQQQVCQKKITYQELDHYSNRVANALLKKELKLVKGDRIAIIMPMNWEAVAIYLGIIKAGMVCVSIAESFSEQEIALRLNLTQAKVIFTQENIDRDHKKLKLYEKIKKVGADAFVVVVSEEGSSLSLNAYDIHWKDFILEQSNQFATVSCDPMDPINILFSSGTTGDPKAIPWTQTTPIKCASDAYCHQNVQDDDILCWHSSLGWMMGPWLIFATLLNKATMAIYTGSPNGQSFGEFVQKNKVTILGVVPTLVKHWRETKCMESLDWTGIKVLTSTGECSNVEDMLYLMWLCHYRPVIEYCGGTEVGGAYITGTVIQPVAPATFTTAAMGLDFVMVDEQGHLANKEEVALIPPSIGLSTTLFNQDKDHHQIYYEDMPKVTLRTLLEFNHHHDNQISEILLRKHGDEIIRYDNGYYRMLGRVDDTMNLSGIKVSSAEIERVLNEHPNVYETAAVAIPPEKGGPEELVVYVVTNTEIDKNKLKQELQTLIKQKLNPLFKISDICLVTTLIRTASNKVMRRVLRDEYRNQKKNRDDNPSGLR